MRAQALGESLRMIEKLLAQNTIKRSLGRMLNGMHYWGPTVDRAERERWTY